MDLSLYFSANELRALIARPAADHIVIDDFYSAPLPEGVMINGIITAPEALSVFLGTCNQQWGPFRHDTTMVVDSNTVRTKTLAVPNVKPAQMLEFVSRELATMTEEGAGDLIDYTVLGPDASGGVSVLGVVAGRVQIGNYAQVVRDAGLSLKRIDVAANALLKVRRLFPQLSSGIKLLVVIDGNFLTLTFYDHGRYVITKKHRLLSDAPDAGYGSEVANYISTMLQFQMAQRRDMPTEAIYVLGADDARFAQIAMATRPSGLPVEQLGQPTALDFKIQAAFAEGSFNMAAYLYNIGSLLKK